MPLIIIVLVLLICGAGLAKEALVLIVLVAASPFLAAGWLIEYHPYWLFLGVVGMFAIGGISVRLQDGHW